MDRYPPCVRIEETTLYKIGVFSQMNRVTIKALRHYDEIGLFKPAHIDESSGYRYYTSEQLQELHQILSLRQMGFSLDEIAMVKKGVSTDEMLTNKKAELLKTIADATIKLSHVEYYLNKGEERDYHVVVKELPEVIVASMRKIIPNYDALFTVVPPMGLEMERCGCVCAIPEYCFNIYHDGEYKEENIDVEICEAVTEMKPDTDMIKFKNLPKVEAACILHKGPYETLGKSYGAIMRWIDKNGYEIADSPRESYIDGLWNKDSPDDWLTEVQFPIRKIK